VSEGWLIETRSAPALTHGLPPISTSRFSHLCRATHGDSIHALLPSQLYLDHSHCLVLAPATLAALPSTRAIETCSLPTSLAATHRGFAFYVAFPKSSIRPLGLPIYVARVPAAPFTRCYPCSFTFYVADPSAPLYLARSRSARPLPSRLLPAMSLIPVAPFPSCARTAARDH
jgi:hypothetical protein